MLLFTLFSEDVVDFGADEDDIQYFTQGACMHLAYEIHMLTGWTIAMVSSSPAGSPDYLGHIFIIDSDGMAIDIRGRRPIEDLKDEWWFANFLHRFWDLKEFHYEMQDWCLDRRIGRDPRAKEWAKRIIELL